MPTLREFMSNRRSEIQAQIKALRLELVELDAAERGLSEVTGQPAKKDRGATGTGRMTLKELALEVLGRHPEGADALTILADIKAKHGLEIARESMSPQLSRLGQEGVLVRHGFVWRLNKPMTASAEWEAQNDETPDAPTSDVPGWKVAHLDDEIPF